MVIFSPCLEFLTLGLGKLDAEAGGEISMNWLKVACMEFCVVLMLGCNVVYTSKPIGEKPVVISSEDWEGIWRTSDGTSLNVKVVDEANGVIEYGPWESENEEQEPIEVYLREWGRWEFCNVKDPEDEEHAEHYMWGRIGNQGGQVVVIWAPDADRFEELVEEGTLPGTVENGNVILGELNAEHMELITTSAEGVLFLWDEPMILFRIEK